MLTDLDLDPQTELESFLCYLLVLGAWMSRLANPLACFLTSVSNLVEVEWMACWNGLFKLKNTTQMIFKTMPDMALSSCHIRIP